MICGIISLILLLVVIGLVIWLLVRGNSCPKKSSLNQTCNTTTDCNSGLVCSTATGVTGATGAFRVCKVAYGGVCATSSECASGQTCRNGICSITLGTQGKPCPCDVGFTCVNNVCLSIVGHPCVNNSDCSTNICENNVCMAPYSGCTGYNPSSCSSYSSNSRCDSSSNSRCDSSSSSSSSRSRCDSYPNRSSSSSHSSPSSSSPSSPSLSKLTSSDEKNKKHKRSKSRDSGSYSKRKNESHSGRSFDSLSDFYTCSDTNCTNTIYSISSNSSNSSNSSKNCSPKCERKCKKESSLNSDCSSYSSSSHDKYLRRGVYVTNQQNQDQTLFTNIEQPIIDVVKTDKLYLLLADGNIVANSVTYITNKKVLRMVRFNNEIIGLDRKGKLHFAVKSGNNWTWEHMKNFPCDVIFINSTNAPSTNLEVLTSHDKAYLYTYSANWKDGKPTSSRKTCEPRYYGKDLTRYMDVNENTDVGKTNDGQKYKHVRAAGFYNTNVLVTVLTSDTFTHVRIIDNNSYFLFEQNCF